MLSDVSVEIIQKCYNCCLHCSSCSTQKSEAILSLPAMIHLLTGLQKLPVSRICLSGGEPLLHPDIIEIVRQITKQHMIPVIYSCGVVEADTGMAAISENILLALKNAGLHSLIFNLPSIYENTYDLIAQSKGHLPFALESIKRAVACGIQTEIHFVPMKLNIQDAVHIVEFAEKAGVQQVNFLKLMPHGRALENLERILPDDVELAALQRQVSELKRQGKNIRLGLPLMDGENIPPCHAVNEKLYIKFDGCVFGCEAFKYVVFKDEQGAEILPDNILERDIQDIYQDSQYLKRSLRLVSDYKETQYACGNCPVQKYLREAGMR